MDKLNHLQDAINRLELELTKKERVKNNLYKLLEEDETNLVDLHDRLRMNQDEILALTGNLNEKKLQYQELVSLSERKKDVANFLRNNKNLFRQMRKDIHKLNPKDRQLLVESMLIDKVTVNYQDDNELDGPGGSECDYNLRWNPEILQRFVEEGKITRLDNNSKGYSCVDGFSF